uniref:Uncharacterized protein n=1 Tax=Rhizophora mucronata TaxID=61149 RepID=A0A2P2PFS9_RHIMU
MENAIVAAEGKSPLGSMGNHQPTFFLYHLFPSPSSGSLDYASGIVLHLLQLTNYDCIL